MIIEEEDAHSSGDENGFINTKCQSLNVQEICTNMIFELINVVIESQVADENNEVIDNDQIFGNIETIHKQVFVKVLPNKKDPIISNFSR